MINQWLDTLSQSDSIILFFVSNILLIVWFYLIFYFLKRARLIEDTPTSRIRSAAQGYVELVGAVSIQTGQLISPLSATPCVWFEYKVQRYNSRSKDSRWDTINQGSSGLPFQINDKTGVCTINPDGADVITDHVRTWYGENSNPLEIKKNTRKTFFSAFNGKKYRYIERFIYIHDVIYALGYFESAGGGRNIPGTHTMTGTVIREWKKNYNNILENYDTDKSGDIDQSEWEQVRSDAAREAEKRRQKLSLTPTSHILRRSSDKRHPFILSNRSQKTLSKRFRYYAIGTFLGGIIGVGLLSWYFL